MNWCRSRFAQAFVALMRMSTGPKPQLRFLVMGAAVGAVLFAVGKQAFDGAIPIHGGGGVSLWRRLAGGHLGGYFSSAVLLAASIARSWLMRRWS
jgi:membrane protein